MPDSASGGFRRRLRRPIKLRATRVRLRKLFSIKPYKGNPRLEVSKSRCVAIWGAIRRVAMLERYLDVARLFRGYTWRDLPTRYLRGYTAPEKIKRADEAARRRTGGAPWRPAVPPGPPGET